MKNVMILANGAQVEKLSCSCNFRITTSYIGRNKNVSPTYLSTNAVSITDSMLFGMLEDAETVIDIIGNKKGIVQEEKDKATAILEMGNGIVITVWPSADK